MALKDGNKSNSVNLEPNMASALCYIPFVGWIAAIVLFLVEKNPEVRWNAIQALVLQIAAWVVSMILGITIILAVLVPLIWVAALIIQLVLTVKAYNGQTIRLPVIAAWADKVAKK